MKKVHIVEPYGSIAMQRMAYPLISELPKLYEVTTSQEINPDADVNIHIPYHTMVNAERGTSKHIILYTHMNPPDRERLLDACERADLITCMSFKGRKELVELGVDPKKLWVIYSAADNFKFSRKIIGVVGSIQPNGRKRESLLLDLAWQYDLSAFEFIFIGTGWEQTEQQLQTLGVTCSSTVADDKQLQNLYSVMTAMLVTGYAEGGSLPILEALVCGVPVLSPDFGYAHDLLDRFYSGPDDLMDWLEEIIMPSVINHQVVKSWSWHDYVSEYAMLLGRLLGETTQLYPEFASDRYVQLLDIIGEEKPKSIVEIGTWKGNRAIQMIQEATKYHSTDNVYYKGFDLFGSQTGEQVRKELSKYAVDKRVVQKRISATGVLSVLIEGETKKTLQDNLDIIYKAPSFVFLDGGHSEETIANDWGWVAINMNDKTVVVFDDYYHEGKPEGMGCNQVVENINQHKYEVTHLPVRTKTEDGRVIGMVKVRKHGKLRLQVPERWEYERSVSSNVGEPGHSVYVMQNSDAPGPTGFHGELEWTPPTSTTQPITGC